MANLLDLPDELLLLVMSQTRLPDLFNFASTCTRLSSVCSARISTEKVLRDASRCLPIERFGIAWHDVLLDVINDNTPAEYVEEVFVEDATTRWTPSFDEPSNQALLLDWITDEKWLSEREKQTIVDDELTITGDESNMDGLITAMLLHLPNLRTLDIPSACWGGIAAEILPNVVSRIAAAEAARTKAPDRPTTSDLPFSKLRKITCQAFNGFYGVDLPGLAPFISLPSVREVHLNQCHEDDFEWPTHLPRSRVGSITLESSSVTLRAARGLARGVVGPCVIRTTWARRRHHENPEPFGDWDYLEIPHEGAGEGEWVVRLDTDPREYMW